MARAEDTTVIILSNVDWDFTWQSKHKFAVGLCQRGYRVVFVNPPRARLSITRRMRRIISPLRKRPGLSEPGHQPRPEGVHLVTRWTLPDRTDSSEYVNRGVLVPFLAKRLQHWVTPGGRVVVISFLPSPTAMAIARRLYPDLLVYACFTNWAASPFVAGRRLIEGEWLAKADFVLANAPSLCEHAGRHNPRVYCISAMVDFDLFHRATQGPTGPGPGSSALCCYCGAVGPRIDAELLAEVSRRYRLRIVGPVRVRLPGLAPSSEVRGQVPYPELPDHVRDVDVFVLPYRVDEYTVGITPAKIFECFATGRPVVSTYLPSLLPYEGLVYISRTHDEFLMNIDRALQESPALRERRIQIARANTTEYWVDALSQWILSALDAKDGPPR